MASSSRPDRRAAGDRYLLCIEGLPKDYTWKDLKDLVRKKASHGIWTEISASAPPRTHGVGIARVQRKEEAESLYVHLTSKVIEKQRLAVHLWDISDDGSARFLHCNCSRASLHGPNVKTVGTCPASWAPATMIPSSPPLPALPFGNYAGVPTADAVVPRHVRMPSLRPPPRVTDGPADPYRSFGGGPPSTYGHQTGIDAGTARASWKDPSASPDDTAGPGGNRSRTVLVQGINSHAGRAQIEALFRRVGVIVDLTLLTFPQSDTFRGSASILYATVEAADAAVRRFHGMKFMELKLGVTRTNDASPIVPRPGALTNIDEPTIVNGSRPR